MFIKAGPFDLLQKKPFSIYINSALVKCLIVRLSPLLQLAINTLFNKILVEVYCRDIGERWGRKNMQTEKYR